LSTIQLANTHMSTTDSSLVESQNTSTSEPTAESAKQEVSQGEASEQILDVGALFANEETDESGGDGTGEGVIVGELELDVGNLLVFDRQEQPKNASPKDQAQRCLQELFEQVFNLPASQSEAGPVASLHSPSTAIPREKPPPKEKPPTRWEKYAKDKGIKKRKRDRLMWDATAKEYRPRWGSNRAYNPDDNPIREHNAEELEKYGAEDPFILEQMKKKERVEKQKKRQVVNLRRASREDTKNLPATVDITTNAPRRQKQSIERAIALAQKSTASIGRFDEKHSDEPKVKRKPKHAPVELAEERKQNLKMVERVLKKTAAESLDTDRAATLAIRDEERQRAAKNREEGGNKKKRKFPPGKGGKGAGGPAKKQKRTK